MNKTIVILANSVKHGKHCVAGKCIDTKQKTKRRMEVKLKHMSQPATREVSIYILNIYTRVLRTNLF